MPTWSANCTSVDHTTQAADDVSNQDHDLMSLQPVTVINTFCQHCLMSKILSSVKTDDTIIKTEYDSITLTSTQNIKISTITITDQSKATAQQKAVTVNCSENYVTYKSMKQAQNMKFINLHITGLKNEQ